jgi:hypothetical protein
MHPNIAGSIADPAIIDVIRNPGDKKIIGEDWHSDTPQVAAPPMGSLLYAVEVPSYGGDTMFSSQYLAYETLSPGLKAMLSGPARLALRPARRGTARATCPPRMRGRRGTMRSGGKPPTCIRSCAPIRKPAARHSTSTGSRRFPSRT